MDPEAVSEAEQGREQGRVERAASESTKGGPPSLEKAIEQVNQIIESLRETLDDMEAVLETLELAERQKNADEYEIDSLRRALNRLQRHREGGNR
jgi:predicted RNase H-like nuclease (RuvC/YqgF family)